jgi:hypothetical protein
MAERWHMEGAWLKNCNCDPGCPCDFNQHPTHDNCEGMVGMRIDKGHYGDVTLDGLKWAVAVWWPGRMDEGNGHAQPYVDESADEQQREALLTIMSGQAGDLMFEIVAAVCPNVHEPIFAPIDFDFDIDGLTARLRVGEDLLHTETAGIPSFNSDEPYRIRVTVPGGFEYTGEGEYAETARATVLRSRGKVEYDHTDTHASLAFVRHGNY